MSIFPQKKLGLGCMRLPMDANKNIDKAQVCEMVDYYMEKGFNYFDTAYGYHDEKSEGVVRECVVERFERDKFYIADKLPLWLVDTPETPQKLFDTQLERTGAKYFDYYLMHAVNAERAELLNNFKIWDWAREKKESGLVRCLGLSFHDKADVLDKILTEHPYVEFVQLQINYMDWESDAIESRKCYEVARRHGKEIIVMEPVKGGLLVNFNPSIKEHFTNFAPDKNVASWALRYVYSLEGVSMVLSGMSNFEQLAENIKTTDEFVVLSKEEQELIEKVRDEILSAKTVGCTSCEYCIKGCPANLKIPSLITSYNTYLQYGVASVGLRSSHAFICESAGKAADCIECGQCESVCPQHLEIIKAMNDMADKLEK